MKNLKPWKPLAALAVTFLLGTSASAQFLPPAVTMPTGVSPRAQQMKADARGVRDDSRATEAKPSSTPAAPPSPSKASSSAAPAGSTSNVHSQAATGKTEEMKVEIAAHPEDLKKKDSEGFIPLHHAAVGGHLDTLQLLLEAGSKVDAQGLRGESALYLAAAAGNVEIVEALLGAGADPNLATLDKKTPLQRAAMEGHLGAVKSLLKAGADASAVDNQGRTALDLAERYKKGQDSNQIVSELLKARKS